ncbi:PREDICTED: uncharacterized protein LOC105555878 [Vollenhovia emeryi]|uniref:uncharacterized protein LOC105555878 n=1 Tax=Vollenhovia emeryi TaxID=411798 RepID=UPI0005F41DCE|nr:PREDICTED: uncharacterized protein LOC105555878 [Vollenhovia emeryi]
MEPKLEIFKIQWRMPHVLLNEVNKLSMLRALESGQYLNMGFRSWDLKTATQLEKPLYLIFALQTGRKNIMSQNVSQFSHCKLSNVKLYLNSECYPYDDMNLDFDKNKWSKQGPFVIIDCSRQNESVKRATVDVRLEFECKANVPVNTTAYCLVIHDRVVQYNPLTSVVRKIP